MKKKKMKKKKINVKNFSDFNKHPMANMKNNIMMRKNNFIEILKKHLNLIEMKFL